jgi:hypothetical protein
MRAIYVSILVAACGGGGSGNQQQGDDGNDIPDAMEGVDTPPANVPAMIAISGSTTETGLGGESVVAGVTMTAYRSSDENTALATATSDAQGKYTMTVETGGMQVDGFLKATKSGYVDLYMYPTSPFIADESEAGVNMMTPSNKDFLNNLAGGNQMAGKGMIGLQIRDASGQPVAGATISSSPASGAYRYTNSSGLPSSSVTSTSADGVAFMFNVPSGPITVMASKSGMTFKSHVVIARPDKFTTTSVTP